MTRRPDFCQQEWSDILSHIEVHSYFSKAWASIIFSGNLAIIQPDRAFGLLKDIKEEEMDDGLSRAWALFWTATKPGSTENVVAASDTRSGRGNESLLLPIGNRSPPDAKMFPSKSGHTVYRPAHTEVKGPKATNKFWANWLVAAGSPGNPIYPMPYILTWGDANQLQVACGELHYISGVAGRMKAYVSSSVTQFEVGAKEPTSSHVVVSEGLFGVHVEIRGPVGQKIMFPIYSGMAYVSGRFSGGLTPVVSHPQGIERLQRVRDGVWTIRNRIGTEFRMYVLNSAGDFVDASYDFDASGRLNRALDGWVRLARVLGASDAQILDAHARAIVVGCDLRVEAGGTVRYAFQKDGASDVELLHWGYGHQLQLFAQEPRPLQFAHSANANRSAGPLLL